ncbi:hypothetical protein Pfo_016686 [Paulownia fortunei]|nr:hypothetical protein Pfo_016686 [Paulownia fortunei]
MDSGNSGSMQSSSGDDEEFDSSRGESISSFLNPSPNFGSISTPHPQFLTHQNPTFFDPQHTHNLDRAFPQSNATTTYNDNNDLFWSRGLRSEHSYANYGNLTAPSSSLSSRTQSLASAPQGPFPNPSPSIRLRADSEAYASRASLGSDHLAGVIKNPKKRTRASNQAPTTVLKTDATNFRQMVQEFTGIPAAPFSDSRRLDLFSAAAALQSGAHLDTLGLLYPLRPSSQKVLSPFSSPPPPPPAPPPSLLNWTMIDYVLPSTNIVIPTTTTTSSSSTTALGASTSNNSNNYPLPSDHLLNLQNHSSIQLQLGGNASMTLGNLSGFQSQETPSATAQVGDNDNLQKQ